MSLSEIANEDLKVSFTMTAGPLADKVYAGDQGQDPVKIITTLSAHCKAASKKDATDKITLQFTAAQPCPFTSATYTFVAGNGMINATATKTRADALLVLRKDDAGTCKGTTPLGGWTLTALPHTAIPCACNVKIADAGQTKAKAQ